MHGVMTRRVLLLSASLDLAWSGVALARSGSTDALRGARSDGRNGEFSPEDFDPTCGIGTPRTLAEAGYSLAAAQAKFGAQRISSTAQQLDFACIQRAIDACSAGGGGVVKLGSKTYT